MKNKRTKAFLLLGVLILSLVLCSCSTVPATEPSETEPSTSRPLINWVPDSSSSGNGPEEGTDSFHEDRVLVGLKPGFGGINKEIDLADFAAANIILESEITEETDLTGKIVITSVEDRTYQTKPELFDPDTFVQTLCFYLKDESKDTVLELVERMKQIKGVEYAEPEYIYSIKEFATSDSFGDEQWGLSDDGILVTEAWELIGDGETSPTIKVGVFEPGVQLDHPDLLTASGNFTPSATTSLDHGTHVAGIIGAIADNGIGIAGVAQVEIVPLDISNFAESLDWAINNGIRIVNASFAFLNEDGTDYAGYNTTHLNAIQRFGQAGGILICAAGNDGENADQNPVYPAGYSNSSLFPNITNVISVGWLDQDGERNDYSNYGSNTVDIFAPGSNILSTFSEQTCTTHNGEFSDGTLLCEWSVESRNNFYQAVNSSGYTLEYVLNHYSELFPSNEAPSYYIVTPHQDVGYHSMSGTSMAAPHVTGVAALLLSIDPDLTVAQISSAILNSAETITITLPDGSSQSVKDLNAYNAVKYALRNYSSNATITSDPITLSKTINSSSTYFNEINYFTKLTVETAGQYEFGVTSTSALNVTLYDSNFDVINVLPFSTYDGETKAFCRSLATGTYYIKVAYAYTTSNGTINITIEPHSHSYDWWTYYNSSTHIKCCCCGLRGTATAVHAIRSSDIVDNKAACLACGRMLDLNSDTATITPDNAAKISVNGSYILPSGIIILVDEDVEAYLNGTLVFYDKDELPATE